MQIFKLQTPSSPVFGCKPTMFAMLVTLMTLSACADFTRRSTGTVLNDQSLEYDVISSIRSNPAFGEDDHIKVEVHQGVVLLAGETVS